MYLIRLDDASEYMDVEKWSRMERLLLKYKIKPIVGIIPDNKDPKYYGYYTLNKSFWDWALKWQNTYGWTIAMHGYQHVYCTKDGGINPYAQCSEFAGLPPEEQGEKILAGYLQLKEKGLYPQVFFAPSHTFDDNTLIALKNATEIRTISDTLAYDIYYRDDFYFIPMQTSHARKVPFSTSTFCYHPNTMTEQDFYHLEAFLKKHSQKFTDYHNLTMKKRKRNIADNLMQTVYFGIRKYRKIK